MQGNSFLHTLQEITFLGKSTWYIIISLLLFIFFHMRDNKKFATFSLYFLTSNIIAGILVWIFKFPLGRIRPKLFLENGEYGFAGLGVSYEYVSFPSGHSITIIATTVALGYMIPKFKYPLYLLGGIIALSRIATNSHFLSDVVVGSYLGALISIILYKYTLKDVDFDKN